MPVEEFFSRKSPFADFVGSLEFHTLFVRNKKSDKHVTDISTRDWMTYFPRVALTVTVVLHVESDVSFFLDNLK